jgi:hypothetical protein
MIGVASATNEPMTNDQRSNSCVADATRRHVIVFPGVETPG